jgi:hypothetical protein
VGAFVHKSRSSSVSLEIYQRQYEAILCRQPSSTSHSVVANCQTEHPLYRLRRYCQCSIVKSTSIISNVVRAVDSGLVNCQTAEDAELLVYLVDEEKDIYIGVLVVVYHPLSRAQLNLYELANDGHTVVYTKGQQRRSRHFTVHPDVRRTPKRD